MNDLKVDQILDQVYELTQQMLAAANDEKWVDVAQFEAQRQQLLMESLANADVDKSKVGEKIRQILEIDREMQAKVIKARNTIRDELIDLNKGKDSIKAYQSK